MRMSMTSALLALWHAALRHPRPFGSDEKFLYVVDRQAVLHVLDVATDGTVSENRRPPFNLGLPAGTVPLGLAVLTK